MMKIKTIPTSGQEIVQDITIPAGPDGNVTVRRIGVPGGESILECTLPNTRVQISNAHGIVITDRDGTTAPVVRKGAQTD